MKRALPPLIGISLLIISVLLTPKTGLAAIQKYTLTTGVVGSGSVNPSGGNYKRNAYLTITALTNSGWVFDHWEGDLSGTSNPTNIRMNSNKHVIAVFVEETSPTPPPDPTPRDKEVVGYFIQWGIYARNYYVKNVVTSGSADKLTVINYAFAGIDENLRCKSIDPYADYDKAFSASESVDGVGDTFSQSLRGNFNQLRKLKQMYPNIKIVISIGGWTESYRFSDAALPENRVAFVSSCINMFINGNFAQGVSDPTIFDGIDIDWEYPGRCGATCDLRPEDTQNFTALLAELRRQLDAIDPNLILTIAAPASQYYYSAIELNKIHQYLDWINLMTYDFHGSWEPNGPTNHHSPLYSSPYDPAVGGSSDETVRGYLAAGIASNKLTLGIPFYGRGWSRVQNINNGLYQPAGRIPRGTYEQGIDDFEVLKSLAYPGFWDPIAQAYWIYNGNEFWTYDNATSVANKMGYINNMNLLGVMFWELSGDDPSGTLINTIANGLQ